MNLMKKINYILFLLILSNIAFAQGGSVYTRYGIGDLFHSTSARRLAIGELGTALSGSNFLNPLNPASWTDLKLTRFDIGIEYFGDHLTQDDEKVFYNDALFTGFTFGFPIDKGLGISFALGLLPVSELRYEVRESVQDTLLEDHQNIYNGDGSLSKMFFGLSVKIPIGISFGANLEYYTGNNRYTSSLDFKEFSDFNNVSYITNYKYTGLGTTIGILTDNIFNLFSSTTPLDLRLSGTVSYVSELTTDTTLITITSIGELTPAEGSVLTKIPTKFIFGGSFTWDKKFLILFDYLYQPWQEYTFNGIENKNLKNLQKVSLGFEYSSQNRKSNASIWEQITYRVGLSYEETQYTFYGENIDQYSAHLGFTFPLSDANLMDIALTYASRGTTESNLIQENIFKAAINISVGELWFVRDNR